MRNIVILSLLMCVSTTGLSSHKDTLLYAQQKKHVFSSQKKKDTFSLSVTGKNIFDSFVTFRITSWQGKVIYEHRFSMGDFKEFGPSETDKAYRRDSDDSLRILRSLDQFFDEESFTNPAIKDTTDMDANMEPREIWLPVWQDKTAIGFHYLLGAEDGRSIVYSKKKNMVITYFTCC